jgi:hypothetical protein
MLEKLARDKQLAFYEKSVNYEREKFYRIGPRVDGELTTNKI